MKLTKRIFIALCIIGLFSFSAFAEDCHDLTDQWFGTDGNDGAVLALESLNDDVPQLDSLLDTYFGDRANDFSGNAVAAVSGDGLFSSGNDRAAMIADLESRINAIITDASVTSFITELEETDDGYVATVYEWTFFDYDDLSDGVGGSDTAGFGVEHVITFAYNDAGTLEIVSDEYTESDVLTGVVQEATVEAEEIIEEETDGDTLSAVTYDSDFDAVKAAIYANTWVTKEDLGGGEDTSYYNPAYRNFASSGGDCANYVSQCLYAGGMDMVTSGSYPWYYKSASSFTYAWTHCLYQTNHFKNRGNYVSSPTDDDIFPGTILYYGSKHVIICVGHNSAGKAVINGHTSDRYRVPWDYSTDTVTHVIQLTQTVLEDMTFEEDAIMAYKTVSVPVYTHYTDTTAAANMTLNKGDCYSIVTSFKMNDELWFAYDYSGTIYYGKVVEGTYLKSYTPEVQLTAAAKVTTNDYLTITAAIPEDLIAEATVTLTDANNNTVTTAMTCSDGVATAVIDCQDFAAGKLTVTVECSGEIWFSLKGSTTVTVTAASTVSSYDGDTLLWTLDKTTGELIIYGPEEIDSADWLRFADKITTVQVSPEVLTLPEDPFAGCTAITCIYGSQPGLEEAAAELGAQFVLMYFWDVMPEDWSYDEINAAAEYGLVTGTGDGLFSPEVTMNRGSFVLILSRMAGVAEDYEGQMSFTDVPAGKYYTSAVAWASEMGIVTGMTSYIFAPEDTITREQAATIISRYLSVMGVELPDDESPAFSFPDSDDISSWAQEHVELLRVKGVINGRGDGSFDPKAILTREEATALLVRVYALCVEDEPSTDTDADTESDAESDADSDAETGTETDSETDTDADSGNGSETDTGTDSGTGGDTATEPDLEILPGNGTDSDADSGTNTDITLQNLLSEQVSAYSGTWGIYYKNMTTGQEVSIGEQPMVAASLIKLYVAGAYCEAVELGEIADNNRSNLKVMITQSSNSACNTIIDALGNGNTAAGMQRVNEFAAAFGAGSSVLNRKMLASGTENYTSPADCGLVMEAILNGNFVSESVSQELLGYLKAQTRTTKIPAGVPSSVVTANKTGELSTVENDAAIIWSSDSTYVLCVMSSDWSSASVARANIVKISSAVYNYLNS